MGTDGEADTAHSPHTSDAADLTPFTLDLGRHEVRRLDAVLDAMPDWDPAVALSAEAEGYRLLYSGLSAEQRTVYDLLCEEGVLDARS